MGHIKGPDAKCSGALFRTVDEPSALPPKVYFRVKGLKRTKCVKREDDIKELQLGHVK